MRVIIAMPAYNESGGISGFLSELASAMEPHDTMFIVADDCSTDGTLQVLAEYPLKERLVVLPAERNLGHGPTTLRALRESLRHQPDVVVAVDGDGQFTGEDMRRLVDLLDSEDLDLVEGVRIGRADPFFRRATSWATRTLVHIRIRSRPLDANTPLRVYRPSALDGLLRCLPSDAITPNLLISALSRVGTLRLREESVASIPRRGGDPAGTTWRARYLSVPSTRFIRFCVEATRQWIAAPLQPLGETGLSANQAPLKNQIAES
jgi:glycosyltransferase involved in cell wall biosynthesis